MSHSPPGDAPPTANSANTSKRKHPHFDDRGTFDWNTSFAEALATAKREKKHLFIELGREL